MDFMTGCLRCPRCHKVPTLQIDIDTENTKRSIFTLICEEHLFEAHGDSPTLAVKHWNMFIEYIITQMPYSLRPERQTRQEAAIFNAAHSIDPKETI